MKVRTLFLVALVLVAASCRCPKEIETKIIVKDSVITKVEERLVMVHDTVTFTITDERFSNVTRNPSHLATRYAISDAFVDTLGFLHHTLENIAQDISIPHTSYVTVHDTIKVENHSSEDIETKYVEVEKPLRWWQTGLIWFGSLALVGLVLAILYLIFIKRKN